MRIKRKILSVISLYLTLSSIAAIKNLRRKRIRRFGVRPMNRKRDSEGFYQTLIKDMRTLEWDEEQFFKYTRMTKNQFLYLLELVSPSLKKNRKKKHICAEQRLIMTLHYLSEGCSMQEIAWGYRTGKTTARNIIIETFQTLWDILSPSQLPIPTEDDFRQISLEFYTRWNIPNCIGAIDGKHVVIKAPRKTGSEYFNYKKSFSLVLMATCDAYMRFTMVDIGASGSNHDSSVLKSSGLGLALMNGKLNIPAPKELQKTNIIMPYFLVGDAAFPLHQNIIRPYPGKYLDDKKNIFNYRVSRARRTIESAFGILTQRWQILKRPIQAEIEVCELITQATVVLHNYLQNSEQDIPVSQRKYCPTGFSDYIDENGQLHLGTWREEIENLRSINRLGSNNTAYTAKNQRDLLAEYFVSREGWIPWQEQYIHRGVLPTI